MRRALALSGVLAAALAAAADGAPRIKVMVHGRSDLLLAPRAVEARSVLVRASGKRCRAGAATPLAVLAAARRSGGPGFAVRDVGGGCSRRAADGGQLFVTSVAGQRNRGRDGWVYKVGRRAGTAGAADPTGPFGDGRLRRGARVTWFWCEMTRRSTCQRTLEVRLRSRPVAGSTVRAVVRGYDDFGRGRAVRGARVRLGGRSAVTGRGGVARLRVPSRRGLARLTATKDGMVRAFDRRVRVR